MCVTFREPSSKLEVCINKSHIVAYRISYESESAKFLLFLFN